MSSASEVVTLPQVLCGSATNRDNGCKHHLVCRIAQARTVCSYIHSVLLLYNPLIDVVQINLTCKHLLALHVGYYQLSRHYGWLHCPPPLHLV